FGRAYLPGDIASDFRCADDSPQCIVHRRYRDRHINHGTAFRPPRRLILIHPLSSGNTFQYLRDLIHMAGGGERGCRLADHLLRRIAKNALGPAIPGDDHSSQAVADDGIVGGFDDRGEEAARFISTPLRRGIPEHQYRALYFAARAANQRATIVDRDFRSVPRNEYRVVGHSHDGALPQYLRYRALHLGSCEFVKDSKHLIEVLADHFRFQQFHQRLGDAIGQDNATFDIGGNDRVPDAGDSRFKRFPRVLGLFKSFLPIKKSVSQIIVPGLNAREHLIERVYENAKFIARVFPRTNAIVLSPRYGSRGAGELGNRRGDDGAQSRWEPEGN